MHDRLVSRCTAALHQCFLVVYMIHSSHQLLSQNVGSGTVDTAIMFLIKRLLLAVYQHFSCVIGFDL